MRRCDYGSTGCRETVIEFHHIGVYGPNVPVIPSELGQIALPLRLRYRPPFWIIRVDRNGFVIGYRAPEIVFG